MSDFLSCLPSGTLTCIYLRYVFIGLDTAVHAYSVATSCLFRIFQPGDGHRIVGYKLSPIDQAHLYIFTSAGSVSKWEWISGKEISRWNGNREVMSVDSAFYQSENDTSLVAYSVQKRKDGKREVTVLDLGDGRKPENVALETHTRISDIKVARQGRVIVAYGGPHIAVGTANARQSDVEQPIQYTWREVSLPTNITCLDVRESEISTRRGHQGIKDNESSDSVDLVVGEADGSILIYHDIMSIFLCNKDGGKGSAPRRLHWHRGLVSAIRWSKDGKPPEIRH